jgi:inner membrane protein
MDLVTHALAGAALGEAVAGRRLGRRSMLLGAATALLPDFDVLGHFFLSNARQLAFHRGITHSLLVAMLLSVLLAAVFRWRWRSVEMPWACWIALFGLPLLSHLLLDMLTCYGTGLFEPFSNYRVALDTIFVVDPFYTLPWLACICVVLLQYKHEKMRRRWNKIGLWFGGVYVLLTCLNHLYVKDVMLRALKAQGLSYEAFQVTPTPMNNLLWMGYTRDATGAWIGYYSLLDADQDVRFDRLERNDSLLANQGDDPALAQLIQLSKGNYCVQKHGDDVYFNDLRFGFLSRWDGIDTAFALRYNLAPGADNSRPLHRTRYAESSGVVLGRLVNRILGK